MSSPHEFQLRWSEFQTNVASSFQSLRQQPDFSDVTLVSGDGGQRFEAHKVILATGSDFFKMALSDMSNPHPLIYLRGVKAKQLEALLDYIYKGEVNVPEADLDDFLLLATELQIKGMIKSEGEGDDQPKTKIEDKRQNRKEKSAIKGIEPIDSKAGNFTDENLEKKPIYDSHEPTSPVVVRFKEKNEFLEQKLLTMFVQKEQGWSCITCGKESGGRTQMRKHVEIHIEGFIHACSFCEKDFGTSNGLQFHVYTHHKGQEHTENSLLLPNGQIY